MNKWGAGLVAGLIGTIAVSVLMLIKSQGLGMTGFSAIKGNMQVFDAVGLGGSPLWGWVWHFVIGTVLWGLSFAALSGALPGGGSTGKGVVFGVIVWLLMMVVWMPLAGAPVFALPEPGMPALIFTLVAHLVFGAVLGSVYGKLTARPTPEERESAQSGG